MISRLRPDRSNFKYNPFDGQDVIIATLTFNRVETLEGTFA